LGDYLLKTLAFLKTKTNLQTYKKYRRNLRVRKCAKLKQLTKIKRQAKAFFYICCIKKEGKNSSLKLMFRKKSLNSIIEKCAIFLEHVLNFFYKVPNI